MKHLLIGLSIMLLVSCKSSGQAILIKADGSLISEDDLKKSSLKDLSPLEAKMSGDTIVQWINIAKLIIELQKGGYVPNAPTDPTLPTYPNFQRVTATTGQTFFPFIIPKVYIVTKNKVIMDLTDDYVINANGLTFLTPSKAGDKIKIINLLPK